MEGVKRRGSAVPPSLIAVGRMRRCLGHVLESMLQVLDAGDLTLVGGKPTRESHRSLSVGVGRQQLMTVEARYDLTEVASHDLTPYIKELP